METSGSDRPPSLGPYSLRPSLRPHGQQRVLCAVFVARPLESPREVERTLNLATESLGGGCEQLLDGSLIVTFDRRLAPGEQAMAAAQCALAIHKVLPHSPIVICTGRVLMEGSLPFGDVIERGAQLLAETHEGELRVDDASAGLIDARFAVHDDEGKRTLVGERSEGEAPRTLLGRVTTFVGRERELEQLELVFRECVDERFAQGVLVHAPAGAGKSRLRHELVERLRQRSEPFLLLTARGDSMHKATPFGLLAPAFRTYASIASSDPLEVKREKLTTRLERNLSPDRALAVAEFLGEIVGCRLSRRGQAAAQGCPPRPSAHGRPSARELARVARYGVSGGAGALPGGGPALVGPRQRALPRSRPAQPRTSAHCSWSRSRARDP